jgi:hypothetical protein
MSKEAPITHSEALELALEYDAVCDCEQRMRSACRGQPWYKEYGGKRYCVLHYPGMEKSADFEEALQNKLKAGDLNFCGAWFPNGVNFSSYTFNAEVNFSSATFNAEVDFSFTTFEADANFSSATFNARAKFQHTNFKKTYFDYAAFNARVVFSEAKFRGKADFTRAKFKDNMFVNFGDAKSTSMVFAEAVFFEEANFSYTMFDELADFGRTKFMRVLFDNARFNAKSEFSGATFAGDVSFFSAIFNQDSEFYKAHFEADANFAYATFTARAEFRLAIFNKEEVSSIETNIVKKANFSHAIFRTEASFSYTQFGIKADFSSAVFGTHAYFSEVTFSKEANFSYALFEDYIKFSGIKKDQVLNGYFRHVRIEKPDHVSFETLTLFPHYFVNVDARKLVFNNVRWRGIIGQEIKELEGDQVLEPQLLLAVTCRQLAINAEDNHRYEDASKFRYWAMELQREWRWRNFEFWDGWKESISKRFEGISKKRIVALFREDWLYWLYWAASGYGERIFRAFLWLIGIWVFFAWLYTYVGFMRPDAKLTQEINAPTIKYDEEYETLGFRRALIYSFGVMSLQKPEPRPLTDGARTLINLETILGPVQAALLLLAIRRKFMR